MYKLLKTFGVGFISSADQGGGSTDKSDKSNSVENQHSNESGKEQLQGTNSQAVYSPDQHDLTAKTNVSVNLPKGLMQEDLLIEFFKRDFLKIGRHNGVNYKSQEAKDLGLSIIGEFQNVLETLIAQKKAFISKVIHHELQITGFSEVTSQQLSQTKTRLESEIENLERQIELSENKQGWIQASLNQYQLGFGYGVQLVIDTEIIFH